MYIYRYLIYIYIYADIFINTYYIPSMFPHATPPKYQVVYADPTVIDTLCIPKLFIDLLVRP